MTSTPGSLFSQPGPTVLLQALTRQSQGSASSGRYRVIFDGKRQCSFITADASKRLGFEVTKEETLTIGAFGGQKLRKTPRKACLLISAKNNEKAMQIEALEIEEICNDHIPIPDNQVIKTIQGMHWDAQGV